MRYERRYVKKIPVKCGFPQTKRLNLQLISRYKLLVTYLVFSGEEHMDTVFKLPDRTYIGGNETHLTLRYV